MSTQLVPVSQEDKSKALQQSLYYLRKRNPFVGTMIQELNMRFVHDVPTAAIVYNDKVKQFQILLNDRYFTSLPLEQQIGVMTHEILHFLHQHLFRLPFLAKDVTAEKKMLFNLAGDMAINQYIKELPPGVVDVNGWVTKNGTPFPKLRSIEEYYKLIDENQDANQDKMPQMGDGSEDGEGDMRVPGEGGYQYRDGGRPVDQHQWEQLDDKQKEDFLTEAKKLIERTIEKTSTSFDELPQYVKDILNEVDVELAEINYKKILRDAIKKNASVADRESTWNRRNKRFGVYAPGTRLGKLPQLNMYVDTSGSISHRELNEFLAIMDKFLKVGVRRCTLGLWHTELYYQKPYKYGQEFLADEVQAGGTELTDVISNINKVTPDLSIILTDGYYGIPKVIPKGEVIWIISKGGDMNHSLHKVGKTISLDKISKE